MSVEVSKIYAFPSRELNRESGDWEKISEIIFQKTGCEFNPDHVHYLEGRNVGRIIIHAEGNVSGVKPNGEEYDIDWEQAWDTLDGEEVVKTRKGDAYRKKGKAEWRRVGKNPQKRKWE